LVLPLSWELVEIARELPSEPVAVIVMDVALVVCHVSVTACPAVTLLLLADKTTVGTGVGADFTGGVPEPELQPVNASSDRSAASPNRMLRRAPILPNLNREMFRLELHLPALPRPLVSADGKVLLMIKKAPGRVTVPTTTFLRQFSSMSAFR
jgi:hypothetical protein